MLPEQRALSLKLSPLLLPPSIVIESAYRFAFLGKVVALGQVNLDKRCGFIGLMVITLVLKLENLRFLTI